MHQYRRDEGGTSDNSTGELFSTILRTGQMRPEPTDQEWLRPAALRDRHDSTVPASATASM